MRRGSFARPLPAGVLLGVRLPECGRARNAKVRRRTSTAPPPPRPRHPPTTGRAPHGACSVLATPVTRAVRFTPLWQPSRGRGGGSEVHRRLTTARCCGGGLLVVNLTRGPRPWSAAPVPSAAAAPKPAHPSLSPPPSPPSQSLPAHPSRLLLYITSAPLGTVPPGEAATTTTVVAAVRSVYLAARRHLFLTWSFSDRHSTCPIAPGAVAANGSLHPSFLPPLVC